MMPHFVESQTSGWCGGRPRLDRALGQYLRRIPPAPRRNRAHRRWRADGRVLHAVIGRFAPHAEALCTLVAPAVLAAEALVARHERHGECPRPRRATHLGWRSAQFCLRRATSQRCVSGLCKVMDVALELVRHSDSHPIGLLILCILPQSTCLHIPSAQSTWIDGLCHLQAQFASSYAPWCLHARCWKICMPTAPTRTSSRAQLPSYT